ncbi:hypothetical protein FXO37_03879 [Capsicum annuum]|nr:hypothetical protein FXO37_03879 [Capsicum annuum]
MELAASESPSPVPSKGVGEEHHSNPLRPSLPSANNQRIPGLSCDGNGESSLATDNVKGTFLQGWHPEPTKGAQQPDDPSIYVPSFLPNEYLHAQLASSDVYSEAPAADYINAPNTRGRRPRKHKPNPIGASQTEQRRTRKIPCHIWRTKLGHHSFRKVTNERLQ